MFDETILEKFNGETINERAERVKKRAVSPKEQITQYFLTNNFNGKIKEHKEFVKKMVANPVEIYKNFKLRLELQGPDADFPEFEGVVGYLIQSVFQNEPIYSFFQKIEYKILSEQLIHKLIGLNIEGRFNFPYRTTIYCIESLLELLDFYYRTIDLLKNSNENNELEESQELQELQVNEKIGPYYHIFRYRSYMTTFTDSKEYGIPNNIIFPTNAYIGATELIKLRCVPILVMGVSNKPVYVDQYLNTPLDFWAHDIQHSKRQIQETLRYYDCYIKHNEYFQRRTVFDIISQDKFYEYMDTFTKNKILPLIIHKPNMDDEVTTAKRNIWRLIIFEVVHEKAWPITIKSLCRNISLRYDEFPVENLTYSEEKNKIVSFHYLFSDPTTIANVVGKIRTGFYDKTNNPNNKIIQDKYRTSKFVGECAKELMEQIQCKNIPSEQYFLALATDKHALQEFSDIKSIDIPDEPIVTQYYPHEPKSNLFDDNTLGVQFKPKVGIEDIEAQASLHKSSEVIGYDDTFEKLNNKYIKYKNKYLKLKKIYQ